MFKNINYTKITGKIKWIKEETEKNCVIVRLKIWQKKINDYSDKTFIDCYFYNYNRHKILNKNLFYKGEIVLIQGSLNKNKEIIIIGSHIKKYI